MPNRFNLCALKQSITVIALALAAPCALAMPIGSALDGQIDFRTTDYGGCFGMTNCTVGDLTLSAVNQDGAAEIYWDGVDGLGIIGGQESDEIDGSNGEMLTVTFANPTSLTGVWFSDLFAGAGDPLEIASTRVRLADGTTVDFLTNGVDPLGSTNGEVFQSFGGALSVASIMFGTPSDINDDHSVAGLVLADQPPASIPEPGTIALLALGLVAVRATRRRSYSRA